MRSVACHTNLLEEWCQQPVRRVAPAQRGWTMRKDKEMDKASGHGTSCSYWRKDKGYLVLLLAGVLHQLTLCALKAHCKYPDRWKHLEWHTLG